MVFALPSCTGLLDMLNEEGGGECRWRWRWQDRREPTSVLQLQNRGLWQYYRLLLQYEGWKRALLRRKVREDFQRLLEKRSKNVVKLWPNLEKIRLCKVFENQQLTKSYCVCLSSDEPWTFRRRREVHFLSSRSYPVTGSSRACTTSALGCIWAELAYIRSRALNSGCSGVSPEPTSLLFSFPYYSPISRYCLIVDSTLICFA